MSCFWAGVKTPSINLTFTNGMESLRSLFRAALGIRTSRSSQAHTELFDCRRRLATKRGNALFDIDEKNDRSFLSTHLILRTFVLLSMHENCIFKNSRSAKCRPWPVERG